MKRFLIAGVLTLALAGCEWFNDESPTAPTPTEPEYTLLECDCDQVYLPGELCTRLGGGQPIDARFWMAQQCTAEPEPDPEPEPEPATITMLSAITGPTLPRSPMRTWDVRVTWRGVTTAQGVDCQWEAQATDGAYVHSLHQGARSCSAVVKASPSDNDSVAIRVVVDQPNGPALERSAYRR